MPPYAPYEYLNRKGILRANAKHQVYQIKKAYYAVQNVVSVFDDSVVLAKERKASTVDRCVSFYEYVKDGKYPLCVFWDHGLVGFKKPVRLVDDGTGRKRPVASYAESKIWNMKLEVVDGGFSEFTGIERRGVPSDSFTTRPGVIEWSGERLKDPVWVDLFTGAVYEVPAKQQISHSCGITFVRIPVYDSPCILTERAALDLSE